LPLVRARMRFRRANENAWTREFLLTNARLRRQLLRELERNGPMLSRQLSAEMKPSGDTHRWWGSGPPRLMLHLLQGRGEIAVAGRRGNQSVWDLASRVYPDGDTVPWREAKRLIQEKERRALGVWLEAEAFGLMPTYPTTRFRAA
jgi:uncharacterized protein